jgi:hypothetical protein
MRLALLPLLAVIALSPPARAGEARLRIGDELPPLRGHFLTGRAAELPVAARGRVALAVLGFSYGSRVAVEAWVARFREDFGSDSAVTFYEVPVMGGAARLARPFIDGGMRRGTPPALHEHVITVWGEAGAWKRRMGHADPDAAYLALLDREGRVLWLHQGAFDAEAYAALAAATRRERARGRRAVRPARGR